MLLDALRGVAQLAQLQALQAGSQRLDLSGSAGVVPPCAPELELQLQPGIALNASFLQLHLHHR